MSRKPNGGTVASVWQRDNGRCWICRNKVRKDEATRDHVEPKSLGGYDRSRNYRLAHARCNVSRGAFDETVVLRIRAVLPPVVSAEAVRAALNAERRRLAAR